jgi:tetratricopeptide (TPR) repeat protein
VSALPQRTLALRTARLMALEGNTQGASAVYDQSLSGGGPAQLLGWYDAQTAECISLSRWSLANWYVDRALALDAKDWRRHADKAEILKNTPGQPAAAVEAEELTATRLGKSGYYVRERILPKIDAGRWQDARALIDSVDDPDALEMEIWLDKLIISVQARDDQAYWRLSRRWEQGLSKVPVEEPDQRVFAFEAEGIAVRPGALEDYKPVAERLRKINAGIRKSSINVRYRFVRSMALVLYRAGEYAAAYEALSGLLKEANNKGRPVDQVFLAMTCKKLGKLEEARSRWESARTIAPTKGVFWWRENVILGALREEAERLFGAEG